MPRGFCFQWLLIWQLFFVFTGAVADERPRILSLKASANFVTVRVNTFEGIHKFLFHIREPMQARRNGPDLRLFQGLRNDDSRVFSGNSRAAMSQSDSRLVLNFIGKRRARLYQIEYLRTESGHLVYRRSSMASKHSRLGCLALSAEIQMSSSASYHPAPAQKDYKYAPNRYLQLSTDADFEYHSAYGAETSNQILTVLNAAEAIYLNQLGISFVVVSQHEFSSSSGNYVATDASQLLDEFREYSEEHHQLSKSDLYHLFTAKSSDDGIAGLAYVGPVCRDNSFSYGLSRKVGAALQPLVTAHEIGHGLAATHPEDTLSSPDPSLMTGLVRADQNRFSDFSLQEITNHLDRYDEDRSCVSGLGFSVTLNSIRGARRAVFRMSTRSQGGDSCQATLYGSSSKSRLSLSSIQTKAKALKSFTLANEQSRFSSRFTNGKARAAVPVYFRVYADCAGAIYASAIKEKKLFAYGAPKSRSIKAGLAQLAANIR